MPRCVLTSSASTEIDQLFARLVDALPKELSNPATRSRRDPMGALRREGTAMLMRSLKEAVAEPINRKRFGRNVQIAGKVHTSTFDLIAPAVATHGKQEQHLIQHLLLMPDAEETFTQAAGLCCRWQDVREDQQFSRRMSAVIYPRPGREMAGKEDAVKLLEGEDVEVLAKEEFPQFARKFAIQPQLFAGY